MRGIDKKKRERDIIGRELKRARKREKHIKIKQGEGTLEREKNDKAMKK